MMIKPENEKQRQDQKGEKGEDKKGLEGMVADALAANAHAGERELDRLAALVRRVEDRPVSELHGGNC